MYQEIDGTLAISVNDWMDVGLTENQFRNDSKRGQLRILRRGINGNTLIDAKSIKRLDRLQKIEDAYGKMGTKRRHFSYHVEIDTAARAFYTEHISKLTISNKAQRINELVNQASILEGLVKGLEAERQAKARVNKKMKMGEFYKEAVGFYVSQIEEYPCKVITNARSFERVFKKYLKSEPRYAGLLHGNEFNDSARKVSAKMENLFLAIYRQHNKPFVKEVRDLYEEFVSGVTNIIDTETGEVYKPEDFCYKGRAMEVSDATIWSYLKSVMNEASIYADRNGQFDYQNTKRKKHNRKVGKFSLSKISMDDVALSRKAKVGNKSIYVYKYIAVDVVSGYYFRPPYILGKPSIQTIIESFRYMFIELMHHNMPMPGELEVEHALMQDIKWLGELFPFVRFCASATEKRAEHNIKALKYGVAHKNGHTRGRWFGKHEAYKAVRFKKSGDFVEPTYDPHTIINDDLRDIDEHNDQLHRLQKTYPGMTRKEVFLNNVNPDLKPLEPWYLFKYIGNEAQTTICNNDYIKAANTTFELRDFNDLTKLRSNNYKVQAYWLPELDGSVKKAYIYQGDTYIGEAVNQEDFAYNECAIERTDDDREKILHQVKRASKQDKLVRDRKAEIPKVVAQSTKETGSYERMNMDELVVGVQPLVDDPEDMQEVDANFDFDLGNSGGTAI